MALSKIQAESMNLADTYAFSGTVTGAGKVLQVVNATPLTSQYATGKNNYVSSTLSLQITPSATSSKIFLQYNVACHNNTNGGFVVTDIYKNPTSSLTGNTDVAGGTLLSGKGASGFGFAQTYGASSGNINNHNVSYLDSPSTTSQTLYLVVYRNSNPDFAYFNINSAVATFTAMEIGA